MLQHRQSPIAGGSDVTLPEQSVPSSICICGDQDCKIPYGLCHCECEKTTSISRATDRKMGYIRGAPRKWVFGHYRSDRNTLRHGSTIDKNGLFVRAIAISKGLITLVAKEDFEKYGRFNWTAVWREETKSYYAVRSITLPDGKSVGLNLSREILGLNQFDNRIADHIDHDTLNNIHTDDPVTNNLRIVTDGQNKQNVRKPCTNKSGFKGVSWHEASGKWQAHIWANGKHYYLGLFATKELAYEVYCKAALELHGEFACLG